METEKRRVDWVILIPAAMLVASPAASLIAANWTDGLEVLLAAGFLGMLAGLVLSISRFRSLTSHLLSTLYGIFWLGYVFAGPLPYDLWRDRIVILIMRINGWIALALRGGTGRDSLLFVLVLSLLFWGLGYIAIWNLVRHQRIWHALLPPGVVLIINIYYYAGPSQLAWYLMLYLLCALLVIVRSYTVIQERRWDNERIGYNSDVRFDLLRSGVVLATVAILVAWVAPTATTSEQAYEVWRRVEGPWRGVEENFNRMFSTLRSQARSYGNPFGRMITLRGPRILTDTPVLDVVAPSDKRFYWRGVVYDRYTGSSWINSDSESVQLDAWSEPKLQTYSAREIVTQTVILHLPVDTLIFAAPQPLQASVAARADVRTNASGLAEVSQLISARTLRKGASYQVISSLSTADPGTLRTAGADYPPSIRDRYLQLPDSLPPSVRTQARVIAGNLDTPYDKASAIEAWLRANVVYDDKTPAPPEDEDGVAYLLSIRRGYCDYYASAMVVMLRSLGVPARVAVGYAQGQYDPAASVYHVTEKDSHSWVEVFFPTYGWVEFEPTASQPSIERPKPQLQVATPTPDAGGDSTRPTPTPRERIPDESNPSGVGGRANRTKGLLGGWLVGLAILGVALALAATLIWVFERRRSRRGLPVVRTRRKWLMGLGIAETGIVIAFAVIWVMYQRGLDPAVLLGGWLWGLGSVAALVILTLAAMWIFERRGLSGLSLTAQVYARLMRFSGWLEVRWKESQTPSERGVAFSSATPGAENLIAHIVDDYTCEQYSPNPPGSADLEQVWRSLSPRLWLAGLRLRVQRSLRRLRDLRAWQQSLMRRLNRQFG
jgi:transglutaminase-like putative cysteine protease